MIVIVRLRSGNERNGIDTDTCSDGLFWVFKLVTPLEIVPISTHASRMGWCAIAELIV